MICISYASWLGHSLLKRCNISTSISWMWKQNFTHLTVNYVSILWASFVAILYAFVVQCFGSSVFFEDSFIVLYGFLRICSPKQPVQINARPGKWGLGTVQQKPSREFWGDLSGDRYIICPKPPYPAEKILDRRQLFFLAVPRLL